VLNVAARLIYRLGFCDYVTDALISLHWLGVPVRVKYKVAVLTYKAQHCVALSWATRPCFWHTLSEEIYSYSVIAKTVVRSKARVGKCAMRGRRLRRNLCKVKVGDVWLKTALKLYLTAQRIIRKSHYQGGHYVRKRWNTALDITFHPKISLQNSLDLSLIKNVWSIIAAAVYTNTDVTRISSSRILKINFSDHWAKCHWFDTWQT